MPNVLLLRDEDSDGDSSYSAVLAAGGYACGHVGVLYTEVTVAPSALAARLQALALFPSCSVLTSHRA